MPTKPKHNQPETPKAQQTRDLFQTPNYAVDLLIENCLLPLRSCRVWEPCAGPGQIVRRLRNLGIYVIGTDIANGPQWDCLSWSPGPDGFDCAITNPPFSLKAKIARRFIELEKPFALLVPGDWSRWMIDAMWIHDCKLLVPDRRINYITPTGLSGKDSASQFHSVWLTRGFGLQQRVEFAELSQHAIRNNI